MEEPLVESMGSGYPAVVQRAPQMVSSLRATVELAAHMESSGVDPIDKSSNSNSSHYEQLNIWVDN